MRIAPHMRRSANAAPSPCERASRTKSAGRALAEIEVVALQLQRRVDVLGIEVGPVREQHDVLALRDMALAVARIDDDRAVQADLFLKARVRVIPVRSRLIHLEAIFERRAGRDAGEADAGHAVHVGGHDEPVPVQRCRGAQPVRDADRDRVAFAKAQRRSGHLPVDGDRRPARARVVHRQFVDRQVELRAAQYRARRISAPRVAFQRAAPSTNAAPAKPCMKRRREIIGSSASAAAFRKSTATAPPCRS